MRPKFSGRIVLALTTGTVLATTGCTSEPTIPTSAPTPSPDTSTGATVSPEIAKLQNELPATLAYNRSHFSKFGIGDDFTDSKGDLDSALVKAAFDVTPSTSASGAREYDLSISITVLTDLISTNKLPSVKVGGKDYSALGGSFSNGFSQYLTFEPCKDLPRSTRLPISVELELGNGKTVTASDTIDTSSMSNSGLGCRTEHTIGVSLAG